MRMELQNYITKIQFKINSNPIPIWNDPHSLLNFGIESNYYHSKMDPSLSKKMNYLNS